ncbi:unnamed protein product [Owenia fusiformis]|uniref:Uncharacterized protein n=1 Tax=Owenia fusiformis TaxID=6347 RepID=A0A8J1T8K4_OWEFU|nr:unnamed protein product [Owenia fusiformis]
MACKVIVASIVMVIVSVICIDVTTACFKKPLFSINVHVGDVNTVNHNGRRRRSAEEVSDYKRIFKDCDSDDNDKLSSNEFFKCFPQPMRRLAEIFEVLDTDHDEALTFLEFQKAEFNKERKPDTNCHFAMLEDCGGSFLLFAHARNESEASMCGALQDYGDCVEERSKTCDLDDAKNFAATLRHMVLTSRDDGVCPYIDINYDDNDVHIEKLPCSKAAILKCDKDFLNDILTLTPPCDALGAYEECLEKTTESCNDEASESARNAAEVILKAYKSTGKCDRNCD